MLEKSVLIDWLIIHPDKYPQAIGDLRVYLIYIWSENQNILFRVIRPDVENVSWA